MASPTRYNRTVLRLVKQLWKLLKVVWRRVQLADSWLSAEGFFIPKEEGSSKLYQLRTVSLLNVEGKVFLSILAKTLTIYMLVNNYMDTSVQKGGIPGISGCLEHTCIVSQLIQEAKSSKGELSLVA